MQPSPHQKPFEGGADRPSVADHHSGQPVVRGAYDLAGQSFADRPRVSNERCNSAIQCFFRRHRGGTRPREPAPSPQVTGQPPTAAAGQGSRAAAAQGGTVPAATQTPHSNTDI